MLVDTLTQVRYTLGCGTDTAQFWLANPRCADSVRWNFGDPASGAANTSSEWFPRHRFSGPGTYTVTATPNIGATYQTLVETGPDAVRIDVAGGTCGRDTVQFRLTRTDCLSSINWNFGDPASGAANSSTEWEPTHVFTRPGTYVVMAVTSDGRARDVVITYDPRPTLPTPPNVITPNADGLNDEFRPLGVGAGAPGGAYSLRVFNRWGGEVFATTDPGVAFTGAGLSEGVYFYHLVATDCAGRPVRWRGPISVVR